MKTYNKLITSSLLTLSLLFLVACGKDDNSTDLAQPPAEKIAFKDLIPESYDPTEAIKEYEKKLGADKVEDPNLRAEFMLDVHYQVQTNYTPMNNALNGKRIKISGFIAPLEHNNNLISEFLLVPYAGACIHTPAPPANQVVSIKVRKGKGIAPKNMLKPVWVTGYLEVVDEKTEIGNAGYRITNAMVELYKDEG